MCAAPESSFSSRRRRIGSITISSSILGYGCHGTVVFLGSLHNRKVAVKRMLSAYDSSAANEIDLLCRTDDHANLIRYFMRETDGEFVYLALELCDRSMSDAVEGGVRGGEVGALEEVVRGVEHLHKVRGGEERKTRVTMPHGHPSSLLLTPKNTSFFALRFIRHRCGLSTGTSSRRTF